MIKFSIIIPTYNRPLFLQRAIQSVLNQKYQNFEIIVIDDCSTNENNEQNIEICKSDKRIRYIHLEQNNKQCHARNVGLKYATGNWIRYLDDDDFLLEDCLSIYVKHILKNKNINVFTTQYKFNDVIVGTDVTKLSSIFNTWDFDTCSIIHHIDCYKKLGGWREDLSAFDDYEFILRYIYNNKSQYRFINEVCGMFDFNVTNSYCVNNKTNWIDCIKKIASIYNRDKSLKSMLIVTNDIDAKLTKSAYNLNCFLDIDIDIDDGKQYDYIYHYNDGSLLTEFENLNYDDKFRVKQKGKDILQKMK